MAYEQLKERVFKANLELPKHGLVILHGVTFQSTTVKQGLLRSNLQALTMIN